LTARSQTLHSKALQLSPLQAPDFDTPASKKCRECKAPAHFARGKDGPRVALRIAATHELPLEIVDDNPGSGQKTASSENFFVGRRSRATPPALAHACLHRDQTKTPHRMLAPIVGLRFVSYTITLNRYPGHNFIELKGRPLWKHKFNL